MRERELDQEREFKRELELSKELRIESIRQFQKELTREIQV